ncbi:MAG: glutamyl-tRNA reductase, partial [Salinivenus sp.]
EEGRSLKESGGKTQPSLSEAPSKCPYLTHDPGDREDPGDTINEALGMTEDAKASPPGTG